jgi:hypothetical protein
MDMLWLRPARSSAARRGAVLCVTSAQCGRGEAAGRDRQKYAGGGETSKNGTKLDRCPRITADAQKNKAHECGYQRDASEDEDGHRKARLFLQPQSDDTLQVGEHRIKPEFYSSVNRA